MRPYIELISNRNDLFILFLLCSRDDERKPITEQWIKENRTLEKFSNAFLDETPSSPQHSALSRVV